jgi:FkbM family methyltransferase
VIIQIKDKSFEAVDDLYRGAWKDINSGKWEPQTFKIIDRFVRDGDIFLDLGAWIGAVSLYAAKTASKVYAMEPDPAVFPFLIGNVEKNPDLKSKIKCYKVALSCKNEDLTLYARSSYGTSSSSLLPRIRDGLAIEKVRGITLNDFVQLERISKIDFIKMDIEGGEFELLPTIAQELKRLDYPTLYISFHYSYLKENQYLHKIKSAFLSKILMKLETLTGIELFRNACRTTVTKSLQSLKDYRFIYTENGQEINPARIQSDPLLVRKLNLVFTNRKW